MSEEIKATTGLIALRWIGEAGSIRKGDPDQKLKWQRYEAAQKFIEEHPVEEAAARVYMEFENLQQLMLERFEPSGRMIEPVLWTLQYTVAELLRKLHNLEVGVQKDRVRQLVKVAQEWACESRDADGCGECHICYRQGKFDYHAEDCPLHGLDSGEGTE